MAKAGGVLRGLLDALAASVSLGLQRGGYAHSVVDYVAWWLGLRVPGDGAVDPAGEGRPGVYLWLHGFRHRAMRCRCDADAAALTRATL